MDELQTYYAICDSIHMIFWESRNYERQKSDQTLPEAGSEGRGLITKGREKIFRSDQNIPHGNCGQRYSYTTYGLIKTDRIVLSKKIHFILCKLYFNKPDFKKKKSTKSTTC